MRGGTKSLNLPGHSWHPVSRLLMNLHFEDYDLLPFDRKRHSVTGHGEHGESESGGESITVVPFTRSPFSLPNKMWKAVAQARAEARPGESRALVQLRELVRDMNLTEMKFTLFAAYPIYVPAYLATWQLRRLGPHEQHMTGDDKIDKAADYTTVALAHTDTVEFRERWADWPEATVSVFIPGDYKAHDVWWPPTSDKFVSSCTTSIDSVRKVYSSAIDLAFDAMDNTPGLSDPRCLRFSEWHEANSKYRSDEAVTAHSYELWDVYKRTGVAEQRAIDKLKPAWLRRLEPGLMGLKSK